VGPAGSKITAVEENPTPAVNQTAEPLEKNVVDASPDHDRRNEAIEGAQNAAMGLDESATRSSKSQDRTQEPKNRIVEPALSAQKGPQSKTVAPELGAADPTVAGPSPGKRAAVVSPPVSVELFEKPSVPTSAQMNLGLNSQQAADAIENVVPGNEAAKSAVEEKPDDNGA